MRLSVDGRGCFRIKDNAVFDDDMLEALAKTKRFNTELYRLANKLSQY